MEPHSPPRRLKPLKNLNFETQKPAGCGIHLATDFGVRQVFEVAPPSRSPNPPGLTCRCITRWARSKAGSSDLQS